MRDPLRAVDVYLCDGPSDPGSLVCRYRPPGFTASVESTCILYFTESAAECAAFKRDLLRGLAPDLPEPAGFLARDLPAGVPT
jgi:hypothetical protein